MRVLWITPGFAADEADLNCIPPLQLLAQELQRRGVDLHIITLEYPFRNAPYRWHGATVYPCNGRNRRWVKPRTLWRAFRQGRQLIGSRSASISMIHSFWLGWASGLGERLSQQCRIPHITTLMGQDVLPRNRLFMFGLEDARQSRLVAVSDFQCAIFEKNTGLRAAHVISWGVESSEIPAVVPAARPLDLIGAGSLVRVKHWEKWLRVVGLAVQKVPGLNAEIIGGGVDRAKLEALTKDLGLEKNVLFTGELSRPEVLAKMKTAKVLLHTARYESFGYVLAEAAMNGCRVLGTPVGALPQFGAAAETDADLARLLIDAIGRETKKQPFVANTMQQTAENYLALYDHWISHSKNQPHKLL